MTTWRAAVTGHFVQLVVLELLFGLLLITLKRHPARSVVASSAFPGLRELPKASSSPPARWPIAPSFPGQQELPTATGPLQPGGASAPAEHAAVPVYLSPISAFKPQGGTYASGEAPSIRGSLFPALTSVRLYDPAISIIVVTNFELNSSDMAEARRHNLQLWVHPEAEWDSVCPRTAALFAVYTQACPILRPRSPAVYLLRYYQLRCAMEELRHDMIFFLEGDNLMGESVERIARTIGLRSHSFDATHNHVSLHASFLSFEFVEAMTRYVAEFVIFGAEKLGRCPISDGADMRFSYYAALEMHRLRLERGVLSPARVLNTAGPGPCEWRARPWEDLVGPWCWSSGVREGPCAIQALVEDFERRPSNLRRLARLQRSLNLSQAGLLPLIHECAEGARRDCIYWSLQMNMKDRAMSSPMAACPPRSMPALPRDACLQEVEVALSAAFKCPQPWASMNKELVFGDGRAFLLRQPLRAPYKGGYVQQFNLHFQGGGCKGQMQPVFEALQRSRLQGSWFTCGFVRSLKGYEHCLSTGEGAVRMEPRPPCNASRTR
uniref:Uncharacterized protein n=1 Tax=Alexandrium catenella TaxID=2925 RepID=A0A7S1SFK4_ALECA